MEPSILLAELSFVPKHAFNECNEPHSRLPRKPEAYLKRYRVRFLGLEPVLGVFERDLKNAPTLGIEPMTCRSLGGHHIHYAMAILCQFVTDGRGYK
ncbi:hypothetical protein DPMN_083786 [Dreissena polymorpha]|uniref:Uncharacterized protein n=1 Tax=Dreissena polymorpha TaxID=45954 RepID=A0A9D4BIS9_DREPO|nr:hypothetical protein DPMN_083786 [Dreissena polymorpha]